MSDFNKECFSFNELNEKKKMSLPCIVQICFYWIILSQSSRTLTVTILTPVKNCERVVNLIYELHMFVFNPKRYNRYKLLVIFLLFVRVEIKEKNIFVLLHFILFIGVCLINIVQLVLVMLRVL